MDNQNELYYLVNENDEVLGAIKRGEAHSDTAKIHRAVEVLITNQANQMLFQKRSMRKDLYPGQWALACGGHVTYGETYLQAAEREVFEELGIHPHLFYVTKLLIKTPVESEQCQIYLGKVEQTPEHFDRDEVEAVTWVDIQDIALFEHKNPLPPDDLQVLKLLMYLPS